MAGLSTLQITQEQMGFLPDVAVWKLGCILALSRGCDKAKPSAVAMSFLLGPERLPSDLAPQTAQCYSPGAENAGCMLVGNGENYKLSICAFSDSHPSPLEQTASLPCHDEQSPLKLRQTKSFLATLLLSSIL